jgi:hypothetical protein
MEVKAPKLDLIDALYDWFWEEILGGSLTAAVIRVILGPPLILLSLIFWIFVISMIVNSIF